jgi:hypothetical protein
VRANYEAVQVVDETRIARLGARDREVRGSATIDAAQLANLLTPETSQRGGIKQLQQLLLSLPGVFALCDESILRHNKQDTGILQIL